MKQIPHKRINTRSAVIALKICLRMNQFSIMTTIIIPHTKQIKHLVGAHFGKEELIIISELKSSDCGRNFLRAVQILRCIYIIHFIYQHYTQI